MDDYKWYTMILMAAVPCKYIILSSVNVRPAEMTRLYVASGVLQGQPTPLQAPCRSSPLQFISIDRKAKIESGQRQTSFVHMLNDKRGPIGKALQGIRPAHRELWFMFGQLSRFCSDALPAGLTPDFQSTASSL